MTPTDLARALQAFLGDYLPMQRNLSAHTIRSYRDTMTLLLRFCRDHQGLAIERLCITQVEAGLVEAFLAYLEEARRCSVRTRNQRLAAIHAFARYLQVEAPEHILHCQRLLAIPFKRYDRPALQYLSAEQMQLLLAQPDLRTPRGRRDATLLSVLYDTGARVQELIDLAVRDVRLEAPAQIQLTGKGRKSRTVPLMTSTIGMLTQHLREHALDGPDRREQPLFANRQRQRFTRMGIRYLIRTYLAQARQADPHLPETISPHTFRHSKAMHMLQAGIPLVIIRDFLGHVDIATSEVYARADLEMKRRALEKLAPVSSARTSLSWRDDASLLAWLHAL
jgi:integrase/recombinase XerD